MATVERFVEEAVHDLFGDIDEAVTRQKRTSMQYLWERAMPRFFARMARSHSP